MMNEVVRLSHGSGGRQTHELIKKVFASKFGIDGPLTDSAILEINNQTVAYTTDSYVVNPVFFPGGNIGKLAVCGTVNDLAVSGAEPIFISVSFIIEEGFPLNDLETIAHSMAEEAVNANVRIVTGDTKVVERGKCDRIFINTSGIGTLPAGLTHISTGKNINAGDKIIINGPLGNHALAILGARSELSFSTSVLSDCASLNHLIGKIIRNCKGIHFMRDLTRGGLAAVLNELAEMIQYGIIIDEQNIPVEEEVRGLCETLGFDPLYLANEGKFIVVVDRDEENKIIEILKSDPLGAGASSIGEIGVENHKVILNTLVGGRRIIDMPSGLMLPRIC